MSGDQGKFQLFLYVDVKRLTGIEVTCDHEDMITLITYNKQKTANDDVQKDEDDTFDENQILVEPLGDGTFRCWDLKSLLIWLTLQQKTRQELALPSRKPISEDTLSLILLLTKSWDRNHKFITSMMRLLMPDKKSLISGFCFMGLLVSACFKYEESVSENLHRVWYRGLTPNDRALYETTQDANPFAPFRYGTDVGHQLGEPSEFRWSNFLLTTGVSATLSTLMMKSLSCYQDVCKTIKQWKSDSSIQKEYEEEILAKFRHYGSSDLVER